MAEREESKAKKKAAKVEKETAKTERAKQKSAVGTKRDRPSDPRASRTSNKVLIETEAGEDADHCYVCFGSYQEVIDTGREWIQCSCTRWLHSTNGKLYPLC